MGETNPPCEVGGVLDMAAEVARSRSSDPDPEVERGVSDGLLDGRRLWLLTDREGGADVEGEDGILMNPSSFFFALMAVEGRKIFLVSSITLPASSCDCCGNDDGGAGESTSSSSLVKVD